MKKRELESWEMAECVALKKAIDAFNAGKPRKDRVSQSAIADALSINQGSVSSYLNGVNALNARVASVIAGMIGIPVENFSPRLASEICEMAQAVQLPNANEASETAARYHSTSKAMPQTALLISQALNDGTLTATDGEELRRMAIHLIRKNINANTGYVTVPTRLDGLADGALSTAENGDNPDDLLKMLEKGMSKQQPTEEPKPHEVREKRTR